MDEFPIVCHSGFLPENGVAADDTLHWWIEFLHRGIGAKKNSFIRTDNYRSRVLKKLPAELGLPKLNFQVLRRTMATLAQTKGGVKDVQGVLGHSKADTTVNVCM